MVFVLFIKLTLKSFLGRVFFFDLPCLHRPPTRLTLLLHTGDANCYKGQ